WRVFGSAAELSPLQSELDFINTGVQAGASPRNVETRLNGFDQTVRKAPALKAGVNESAIRQRFYNRRTFLRKTSMMSCTSLMRRRNAAPKNPAPAIAIVARSIASFWKKRMSDHASNQR